MKLLIVFLSALALALVIWIIAFSPEPDTWSPQNIPMPELALKYAWDDQPFIVPPPALMPPAFYETPRWKQWWHEGDITTLDFVEADGTRYVAQMLSRSRDVQGKLFPMFQRVSKFGPNGMLATETTIIGGTGPSSWKAFAEDGETVTMEIMNRTGGKSGTPFVEHIWIHDDSGKRDRLYEANALGEIFAERDMDGPEFVGTLNGGSQFDRTREASR